VKSGLERFEVSTCNECRHDLTDVKIQTKKIDKTHTINFKVCPNCNTENPTGQTVVIMK